MPGAGAGAGAGVVRGARTAGWRGLQATTLVHRVASRLRPGRGGSPPSRRDLGGEAGGPLRGRPGVHLRAPDTGRDADPDAGTDAGLGADLDAVLDRARAAGAPPAALAALARTWTDLDPRERRGVARPLGDGRAGPLRVGGAPARQVDGTTCGSAVLGMLAAAGDPVLALWLVTGRRVPGHLPPELRTVPTAHLTSPDAAVRFGALQRALHHASTRRALGPLPWPSALGTPPWGAARTARFGALRDWTHVLVDDTDPVLLGGVLGRADAALAAGVPVPLFTGGDLGAGPAAAVPRHVVLLVPRARARRRDERTDGTAAGDDPDDGPGYAVFEPGSARVVPLARETLAAPGGRHPALGGWSHVCWAVLPR